MEKLELKHLAPYLPYGLKFYDLLNDITHDIVGIIEDEIYAKERNGDCYSWYYKESDELPILRPLSNLTKEIELNGKKFVPINILRLMYEIEESYRIPLRMYIDGNYTCEIIELPYDLVSRLFEWHFDVFGLIDKGWAVDVNSLK